MKINNFIERLQTLQENLGNVNIVLVEHGFNQGAVYSYVRDVVDQDIQYNSDLQGIQGTYVQTDTVDGVVIGVIPQFINYGKEQDNPEG